LLNDEVHVWRADLNAPPDKLSKLLPVLDGTERSRAERFVFDKDRTRFIVARSVLRLLAARYLDGSPEEVEFTYGPQGKPALRQHSHLHFNLAHSDGLALYAFARVCKYRCKASMYI